MNKGHIVKSVNKGSIADSLGILPGDVVIKIDDNEIEDIFDYQFFTLTDYLVLLHLFYLVRRGSVHYGKKAMEAEG